MGVRTCPTMSLEELNIIFSIKLLLSYNLKSQIIQFHCHHCKLLSNKGGNPDSEFLQSSPLDAS